MTISPSPSSVPPGGPDAIAVADVAPASDDAKRTHWGVGPALLALLATFGVTLFVGIPELLIGDATTTAKIVGNVVSSLLQNAAFVGIPVLILGLLAVGPLRRRDFGLWTPPRPWVVIGLVVAAFVAYLLLAAGLSALLGIEGETDDLPEKLGAKETAAAGVVIAYCVTVFAPIGEEFLLRGVIFPGLRNSIARFAPLWLAVLVAAVIDGVLFGALHIAGSKAVLLPILALFGIVLCLLYQFSGTLYAPIVLHATNNTIAIASALGWKASSAVVLWLVAIASLALIASLARRFGLAVGPVGRRIPAADGDG